MVLVNASPMIELQQLAKRFVNGVMGLEPTTLTIAAGEYFVLCGPSGAGKSTLLRLIAGLEQATSGTVRINGHDARHCPPHHRGIAYVPQRVTLYPQHNVAKNIALGLEFEQAHRPRRERLSTATITQRVEQAATQMGIAHLLKNRADQVSGGEAKRIMLARAIVRQASIWLLDEPLGQLDPPLAEKLSEDLHLLQKLLSRTIIHVTHDPNEAMALADRVGLLGGGRMLQTGTPSEIYAQPSSRTVGLHFGRPAIHLIDGHSDGIVFVADDLFIRVQHPPTIGVLTLGVRVEDVAFHMSEGYIRVAEGMVRKIQPLGRGWLVSVGGATPLRGIWDGEPPAMGTELPLFLREERLHWFDATGQRLETGSTTSSTT